MDERRIPTVARSELTLRALGFREHLTSFEAGLSELTGADRRSVRILVAELAAGWFDLDGPGDRTLVVEVALGPSTLRVDAHTDPPLEEPQFWRRLISRRTEDAVDPWKLDRRRSSGVWFELHRAGPTNAS